ncbi:MAG TPA: hypothetical protein VN018_01090 [Brevundimonas sp.]|nr:hypothetical protein [Brevundimonas sp.]
MFWKIGLLGLVLSATAFDVTAQSRDTRLMISEPVQGYAYYNRPGASLNEHDETYRDCLVATSVRPESAIAVGWLHNEVLKATVAAGVENCMISKGWRVFQLPEDQGRTFSQLSDDEFKIRFAPLVGTEAPPGMLARAWNNETARPASYHTPSIPRAPSRHQLSIRSFGLRNFEVELRTSAEARRAALPNWNIRARGAPLERAPAPGPGNALIIVAAIGSNRTMQFTRTPESGDGGFLSITGTRDGAWQAFEVPAGRWRISRTSSIFHCLGAPAFDIVAGEVVYAGAFNLAGDALGPDLHLRDVPDRLDAALMGRLRPAAYENGSTASCPPGGGIYPLEFDGAPFQSGYHWGSRALAETPEP